jgi:hypothetical protein
LFTIFHVLSKRASEKKSTNETWPQHPSSASVATAASPTCSIEVMFAL